MTTPGQFFGIGVGPGDSGLIPVAAVAALRAADLIYVPRATSASESVAKQCLGELELPAARFREIGFLMDPDRSVLAQHYAELAGTIASELRAGRTVAYLTIGDTLTYSTYGYLLAALRDLEPDLRHRTFPGVTSFAATAAALSWPLGEGKERILILPCPDDIDQLRQDIESHDVVVLMKIGKRLPQVIDLLGELGLLAHCAFGHRVGLPDQQLYPDLNAARPAAATGYLSTLLIRRQAREQRHVTLESKFESKTESKTESKPNSKLDSKRDSKADSKADSKPDPKPDPKPEASQ
jgi:precorrin-2/cobalt-factor-2 C20-methyltransferase